MAAAYRSVSLATLYFSEALEKRFAGLRRPRFVVRDYSRCFTEVDVSFVRDILLLEPDIIGLSSFFWNLEQNIRLAELAKSLRAQVFTVFGGPQVGSVEHAARLMEKHPSIDAILCGEADLTFPELVFRVLAGEDPAGLPGLVSRQEGEVRACGGACFVEDLAELPLVFHDQSEYLKEHFNDRAVVPLQTLRGCKGRCSYCLYGASPLRLFPLERVAKEIAFVCSQRAKHVRVCDGLFGGSKSRAMELFSIIKQLNRDSTFYIYPDPDHVDADYVRAARDANCRMISLGVETMDRAVSAAVGRKFTESVFRDALAHLAQGPGTPQVDMMLGLPGQTAASLAQDLSTLRLEGADHILFSPLMVFPGTSLADTSKPGAISTLQTPQRFGYDRGLGTAEYCSLLATAEAFRLLRVLHRTDRYIRHACKEDSAYARGLSALFSASSGKFKDEVRDLNEALHASAAFLRENARCLAEKAAAVLAHCTELPPSQSAYLPEVAKIDILEAAMHRRREELAQGVDKPSPYPRVLLPDELVRRRWALSQEAWLQCHAVPYAVACGGGEEGNARSDQVCCVYYCPDASLYFVDSGELSFLQRFSEPTCLFDADNPYSSAVLERAANWIRRGVLVAADSTQEGGSDQR